MYVNSCSEYTKFSRVSSYQIHPTVYVPPPQQNKDLFYIKSAYTVCTLLISSHPVLKSAHVRYFREYSSKSQFVAKPHRASAMVEELARQGCSSGPTVSTEVEPLGQDGTVRGVPNTAGSELGVLCDENRGCDN